MQHTTRERRRRFRCGALPRALACVAAAVSPLPAAEFEANALFVAAQGADAVIRVSPGFAAAGELVAPELVQPVALAFGPDGHLYVACAANGTIVDLAPDGAVVRAFGAAAGLSAPSCLAIGPDGNLYVGSEDQDVVMVFSAGGQLVRTIGGGSGLDAPRGLLFGPRGSLLVSSSGSDRLLEFEIGGALVRTLGESAGLDGPTALGFGPSDRLFVACADGGRVVVLDRDGNPAGELGVGTLVEPRGLAFGPDGRLYVADASLGGVQRFSAAGEAAGGASGFLDGPRHLAFAPARFRCRLDGSLERLGSKSLSIHENVSVSYAPGARRVLVELGDDPADDVDLASLSGGPWLVGHGFESDLSAAGDKRLIQGSQFGGEFFEAGAASLLLKAKGQYDADGRLVVASLSGSIHRSGGAFAFAGTLSKSKLLQ